MHSLDENPIQERSLFKRAARTFALIALPVAIVIVPVFWNILTKLFDVTNQCSTSSAGLIWSFSALANHAILSMLLAIACTEAAAFVLLSILQVASMLSKIKHKAITRTAKAAIHRIKPITLNAGQDKTISDEADQHEFLNFDWKRLFLDKLLTVIFVTRGFIFLALSFCAGVLPLIFTSTTSTTCLRPGTTTFVMQLSTFLYAAGIASVVQLLVQQFILFKAYINAKT